MRNTFLLSSLSLVLLIAHITNIAAQFDGEFYDSSENIRPRLLAEEEGCGISPTQSSSSHLLLNSASTMYVVGGDNAVRGAYPWMALLGYINNGRLSWKCGGSLITSRHVLTVAHCVTRTLRLVRLGEWDIESNSDGPVQDIRVRPVQHSKFNNRDGTNDIAILHLEQDANFTDYVWPICLPFGDTYLGSSFDETLPTIAGWGLLNEGGKRSNVLQDLELPILDNSECKERFRSQRKLVSENQFDDSIICAGDLDGGHDSCQGDSGGPMMQATNLDNGKKRFYQIGIVSYGIGCAKVDTPGVYTRVSEFIDWIQYEIN